MTGLSNGERAFFQVRAVNAVGPSEPSNEADATPRGAFSTQRTITMDVDADSVQATDLDGDGDPDVLFASWNGERVAWHENLGGGAFSAERVLSTDDHATSVFATDLDGDGDADIIAGLQNETAWHENLGGGEFSAQHVITNSRGAGSLHAADLDGDGDPDVLTPGPAWYENQSDGGFSERRDLPSGDIQFVGE